MRRWEQTEGLPVYRHSHQKQATVYAFQSEIDSWLENRSSLEKPGKLETTPSGLDIEERLGPQAVSMAPAVCWPLGKWPLALVLLLALAVLLLFRSNLESPVPGTPVRLTADAGVNIFPAISRDGKLLVYSSDRAGGSNLKLWVQPLAEGRPEAGRIPFQITDGPGDDVTPDFSPDGARVTFRVRGEQPGIYVASVGGSERRKLTDSGWKPRFSPDGNWIAFLDSSPQQPNGLYIVPARGGQPKAIQVRQQIADSNLVWSPDGSHLIFTSFDRDQMLEWWAVPRDGGEAIPLGVGRQLRSQGLAKLSGRDLSQDWQGRELIISVRADSVTNLWEIPLSQRPLQVAGPARRLTFGSATTELWPRVSADGQIVFSNDFQVTHLCSLSIANATSAPRQLTYDSSLDAGDFFRFGEGFSVGKKLLVFSSRRSGDPDIWAKDLSTGKEWSIAASGEAEEHPLISPDESAIVYTVRSGSNRSIQIAQLGQRLPRTLCSNCGPHYSWMPDSKRILYSRTDKGLRGLSTLDVATGLSDDWVNSARFSISYAAVSPDGRWAVVSTQNLHASFRDLWLAPVELGRVSDPAGWLRITQTPPDVPIVWSASSDRLFYFSASKDGHHCLWSRRWDGMQAGPEEAVRHFHDRRRFPWSPWLTINEDRLVLAMTESTSNIWAIQAGKPH